MDELLNNAPCGFLAFADNGELVEVNATLLELLGYERGELLRLHVEKIFSVAGRIFYQTHFFPLLRLHGKVEELYMELRSAAGESIPVLANAVRRQRDGKIFNDCIFVAMRQRSQFEDEILRAKREAESANRAKDEFLSVVSHELRTPLNAILGWSQMMQAGKLDAVMVKRAVETIIRNARSQIQLIEDLLDFSRIISGKLRLEVGRVDLAKVVEAAVDVVMPAAQAKAIRLQTILDSDAMVYGDADRLQQVLWNLLSNSIKFTPRGGRVQVRLGRVNSSVEISVCDTGKGISAEFLPYVFERFRQADNTTARQHGGLGLGLAITRHIVELHGGAIRAESPGENQGAVFTVTLPIMVVHGEDVSSSGGMRDELAIKQSETAFDAPSLDGLHALIVDDEADSRDLLTMVLTMQGARVTTAATVAEAVEKFQNVKPDLIISDIEMPGEDGFSLIKKLRVYNQEQKRKIPAIALTGHASPADRLKILSAGYQMHLAKPIEPEELLVIVANFADWSGRN